MGKYNFVVKLKTRVVDAALYKMLQQVYAKSDLIDSIPYMELPLLYKVKGAATIPTKDGLARLAEYTVDAWNSSNGKFVMLSCVPDGYESIEEVL